MQKNIILGIVLVLVLGGIGFYALQGGNKSTTQIAPIVPVPSVNTQTPPPYPRPAGVAPSPSSTATPVKTPLGNIGTKAAITKVVIGTTLGTNGAVGGVATTFAPTTKTIYAGLAVKNVTVRTQLSYVRYYNGKYVDSKVSHPSTDGVSNFHFAWSLVPGQTRKAGTYSITFYVNGKKAQTATYTIK